MPGSEIVVIGGGIVGTSAAALLAERGASVTLVERSAIGAGASGRNLGAVQHPLDQALVSIHEETLALYREMAAADAGFAFPAEPAGLLVLADDRGVLDALAAGLSAMPELRPDLLAPRHTRSLEPGLAPDLWSLRLSTGYPIPPDAATAAMAQRARTAGARIEIGSAAVPAVERGQVAGVILEGARRLVADRVLVAAGPWSPYLVEPTGRWRPIVATWGATAQLAMANPPRHVVEEARVEAVNRPVVTASDATVTTPGATPSLFTLAAAGGIATIGSTFLAAEPDHRRLAPLLVQRGLRFLPGLREAAITGTRACARPQSVDGRPLLGSVPGVAGLYFAAGHGPWGISCGPATARLVVDALLGGSDDAVPAALRVDRLAAPERAESPW